MYVDESQVREQEGGPLAPQMNPDWMFASHQNLQPFPEDWISQGRFLSTWDQNVVPQGSAQPQAPPTGLKDDDRAGSVHIRGRGTVMTFMFQVSPGFLPVALPASSPSPLASRSGWTPAGSGTRARAPGCCCRCAGRRRWTSSELESSG